MAAQPHAASGLVVDEAIMRVLDAERSARAEVRQCLEDAERIRQEARVQARGIAERAAERVAAVHRLFEASIHARIAALEQQRLALLAPSVAGADEPDRISRALDRLATELGDGSA